MRTVSCGNKVLLLLPHLSDGLTGGIVEQVAWPFRGSSDLARLVSDVSLAFVVTRGDVAGQGEVDALESGARILVRRWWVCVSSRTSSMG